MEINSEDREILERLESELWEEETRFNIQRMNELIADDFFEFGRYGRVYQRQDTLAIDRQSIDAVLPLPKFCARLLDKNTAQVTYDSAVKYKVNRAQKSRLGLIGFSVKSIAQCDFGKYF